MRLVPLDPLDLPVMEKLDMMDDITDEPEDQDGGDCDAGDEKDADEVLAPGNEFPAELGDVE